MTAIDSVHARNDKMATIDFDKENLTPLGPGDAFGHTDRSPASRKESRQRRSKSIGPGALDEINNFKEDSKDRRKSAFIPATKSILSKNEDAQKAARRRTMGNRRVSFAPEATLHTWDVIELGRDQTTSTDSSDSTRRNSQFSRSTTPNSDGEEQPSSPRDESNEATTQSRASRRTSGVIPVDSGNPDDLYSSSIASDESGSDEEEEAEENDDEDESGEDESEDEEGTAMSLDIDENTVRSVAVSEESTGSSARLEAALQQAAQTAGTRGIEYDEYGDMSMEIASEEITNAFKPWAQKTTGEDFGSASMDQENINPFHPAFVAQPSENSENVSNDDDDASMDMTRAVGGIAKSRQIDPVSSPFSDATMEMTQAVGKITSQKRPRSTADTGSPGIELVDTRSKRRRSSAARSSMGDDSMELTMVVGGIRSPDSPARTRRTRSMGKRRSSGVTTEIDDPTATMEFTRAVGGIRAPDVSGPEGRVDGDEELSMELTTVIGRINTNAQHALEEPDSPSKSVDPPPQDQSPSNIVAEVQNEASDVLDQVREKSPRQVSQPLPTAPTLGTRRTSRRQSQVPSSPVKTPSPSRRRSLKRRDGTSNPPEETPKEQPSASPSRPTISYPDLDALQNNVERFETPPGSTIRRTSYRTPESAEKIPSSARLQQQEPSPEAEKRRRSSPVASTLTPERSDPPDDGRTLNRSIMLMSTPRKETLRSVSPVKRTPVKPVTPSRATPQGRRTPKLHTGNNDASTQKLHRDLEELQAKGTTVKTVGLQEFLTTAGIRFMDLTTTKRRVTTAATPSKANVSTGTDDGTHDEDITLESSVVAAACTAPELDLYRHACHELRRYTKEGKQMVAELEAETLVENPPLIRAYVNAAPENRFDLDVQMRDMKTNARFRSKELWYAWRSKLLDELMVGLQKIGEGLIEDDDLLGQAEEVLDVKLPDLTGQRDRLQDEVERLGKTANRMTDVEKAEIHSVREDLTSASTELDEKRRILERLRQETQEQERLAHDLSESKLECTAAIQEANRAREACRSVSLDEVAALRDSVKQLEGRSGWAVTSASSSPSTVTMVYRSQLELTFQPAAFRRTGTHPNAPVRLSYVAGARPDGKKGLTTSLRFFLQLLKASLQALPQCTTRIADLLALVSDGWDTALTVAEAERRLSIETLTESQIVGDERLDIRSAVLLHKVRTKVLVTFGLTAWVSEETMRLQTSVEPRVIVVYGEQYHEKNMTEFMRGQMGDGFQDWDCAVQEIRAKLIVRGVKGTRK